MDLAGAIDGLVDYPWVEEAAREVEDAMEMEGAHEVGHLRRVLVRALELVEAESDADPDREVVAAAALFHDVVNVDKDDDGRAEASAASADRGTQFFRDRAGWSDDRLRRLRDAVTHHSWSREGEPQTIEGAILTDADRLEAIGAIGIARTFHVAGQMDSDIVHPTDPFADDRPLEDTEYAVDHFFEKLLEIRDQMHTDRGREIAEERHARLRAFLEQLDDEIEAAEGG